MLDRVAATGMLPPGGPLVVGVSGGRDSLCLLDLAVMLVGSDGVLAVHVHHGLRGAGADQDAVRTAAAAVSAGVGVRTVRLRRPQTGRAATGSPVAWARDARREALRAAADGWGGPGTPVAVAHTASDQAETVLLRAISSPGVRALGGIAVRDDARHVVRPLLAAGVTRAQTGDWCRVRGIDWVDDPSNPGSPRGRVRAILEQLEAIDPRASASLVATAGRAREDDAALQAAAQRLVRDEASPGTGVARAALAAAPPAVARRALRLLAEEAVGARCPRVELRLPDVLRLDPSARGRAAVDLGHGVRAVVTGTRDPRVRCAPSPAAGSGSRAADGGGEV